MANVRSRLRASNVLARVERALKLSHQRYWLPPPENPYGVPTAVMKALAAESLPLVPVKWNARLQELLTAYKSNGGKSYEREISHGYPGTFRSR